MISSRWPLWLVLALCSVLAFWTQGPGWVTRDFLFAGYGLSRESLAAGHWWTYFTHAFFHGSWWHAACNLAGLWVVGRHLADQYGPGVFLALLGLGVLAGGLVQTLVGGDGILIGISGGVMAQVTAAGFLWAWRPVALRVGRWRLAQLHGSHLGWGVMTGALALALAAPWLPESGSAVGHACHAGAALAGGLAVWLARLCARR
jgi:membrane associated rhomboid family serine protease